MRQREIEAKRIFSKGLDDPRKRLAVLTQEVKAAKLQQVWPKGMQVLAWKTKGCWGWSIERVKWRKPYLPLLNQCVGVPYQAVRLEGTR